jgi:hypothetical protein
VPIPYNKQLEAGAVPTQELIALAAREMTR